MLIRRAFLERIVAGEVTLAFRRWRRPTVRAGGTLRTWAGVLAVDSVDAVPLARVRERDARAAGYESRRALVAAVGDDEDPPLYRIALRFAGADPRLARREDTGVEELALVEQRLERLDRASRRGAWTAKVLRRIEQNPGMRAAELAASLGRETLPFKADVCKLKELGLTESLDVGYRLSRRGRALMARSLSRER